MENDKFIPTDKHIFTQKMLEEIDIDVIYTSMVADRYAIYVFGGDNGKFFTPSVESRRFDFSKQKWHKIEDMPHYLWGSTAQIIGDEVFIMGGGRQTSYSSRNMAYNVKANFWKAKDDMAISRKGLVSGIIDDTIYITCGYHMWGAYDVTPHCYAYNPKTDTWKKRKKAPRSRAYAMSVVVDKFLYVLGGYTSDAKQGQCIKMDRYCPETDDWEVMPDIPRPRPNAVAVAIDSKIFILCGISQDDYNYTTMDYYDTITRKWTTSDIPTPQLESPGVATVDNKIYLTGGINKLGEYNRNLYEITYGGMKE